jgi:hypothetical protein
VVGVVVDLGAVVVVVVGFGFAVVVVVGFGFAVVVAFGFGFAVVVVAFGFFVVVVVGFGALARTVGTALGSTIEAGGMELVVGVGPPVMVASGFGRRSDAHRMP